MTDLPDDRERAEQYARRLASIVESCDDAIISKNLDGTILSWNEGAEHLFGYSAEEAVGKSITILIPMDRLDRNQPSLSDYVAARESFIMRQFVSARMAAPSRFP
jgi:PAS domain S-box-containing protein